MNRHSLLAALYGCFVLHLLPLRSPNQRCLCHDLLQLDILLPSHHFCFLGAC